MQSITYIVELPVVGQSVTVDILPDEFVVNRIEGKDSAIIENKSNGELSRIVVTRGKWQVEYFAYPHVVTFIEGENKPKIGGRGRYVRQGYTQHFTVVSINSPREVTIRFDTINPFDPQAPKKPIYINKIMQGEYKVTFRVSGKWIFKGSEEPMDGKIEFDA